MSTPRGRNLQYV
ncbi:hypothetical protein PIIN_10890 [Serendipita indica DSM 11827]|uniref:Uncharacterized protein n=1 Tax=Serendipita indica (strain DSM 11827) TaxID=1109443 RepID=G4U012_SERID|nr:hypothetical protein PIIN_10890 [Serendipita indica DSM 11827]